MKLFKSLVMITSAFAVVIYAGLGVHYYSYSPENSSNYLWGVYHVHSTFSDGHASPQQICEEAAKSRLHLVILTDHGLPNPDSTPLKKTVNGVTLIGGSEAGLPEGHLSFFGAETLPWFKMPPYPPDAVRDVTEWGGFTVLSYVEDPVHQWEYWDRDLMPDGIEVINITSYFRRMSAVETLTAAVFTPFSSFYFMKYFTAPTLPLRRWDELLTRGPVFGFYASNAHGGVSMFRRVRLPIPSYSTVFSLVGMGIDPKYKSSPDLAIRKGDFFSIIRGAGEPQTFEFHAESEGRIYPSGSSVSGSPQLSCLVETQELRTKLVLKRNGQILSSGQNRELHFFADSPGIYRAEVYLEEHPFLASDVPWILSNPIFVDGEPEATSAESATSRRLTTKRLTLDELRAETDEDSSASFEMTGEGAVFAYRLQRATPEKTDRWVSLALRKKMDLSSFAGFYIDAKSNDTMRYWIEIRSGEASFYSSFKLQPRGNSRHYIPFTKFYLMFRGRESIPLEEIDSLFITVNNLNSMTGFSSGFTIKETGFYSSSFS
jgi:hypothetical protein